MTQCQSEGCDEEAVTSIPFLGVPLLVCAVHTPPLEQLTDAPMCYKDDSPANCGPDRSHVPMSEIHDTIPAEPTVDLDPAAVNGVAFAGGWMIAQACDLCVAHRADVKEVVKARFQSFAPRIGRVPAQRERDLFKTAAVCDFVELGHLEGHGPIGRS